jgi:hypothetical protein
MRFSLMITTRKRVEFLKNLMDSLDKTISNKKEVEIHINHDTDDIETRDIEQEFKTKYPELIIDFHSKDRSPWLIRDFVNWSIDNFAKGKYILPLNDDIVFKNENWDELAWLKLEDYLKDKLDGVVYGLTEDNETSKKIHSPNDGGAFTCFPLVSMAAIKACGWYSDPEFKSWGADMALYKTYSAVNRICDLRNEINIFHISVHSGRRPKDDVFLEMANNCAGAADPNTYVGRDVRKITDWINTYNVV